MSDPVHIGALLPAMERTFAKMLEWQKTPEGIEARAKFEAKQEQKRREELDELCSIRHVPADIRTRPLALSPWESMTTLAALVFKRHNRPLLRLRARSKRKLYPRSHEHERAH